MTRTEQAVNQAQRLQEEIDSRAGGCPKLMIPVVSILIEEIAILKAHVIDLESRNK